MTEKPNFDKLRELMPPDRQEYIKGNLPLYFSKIFSDGSVLIASDNEEGIASVVIKRGDEVVVDFSDLLQGELVTPRKFKKEIPGYEGSGEYVWSGIGDNAMVGDWRKTEQLFQLLHEIGHATQAKPEHETDENGLYLRPLTAEEGKAENALLEGDANEYAKNTLKRISDKLGLDLIKEIFPNGTAEMEELIRVQEAAHSETY